MRKHAAVHLIKFDKERILFPGRGMHPSAVNPRQLIREITKVSVNKVFKNLGQELPKLA